MRIAINGVGVAGPTLAWWLRHYGHEPVLFEKSPQLRTGGYVIDFWGVGYDVAEQMGILPTLQSRGYAMESLRIVNRDGRRKAGVDARTFQALMNGRFFSIPRGDLAAEVYRVCSDVETHFGVSVVDYDDGSEGVNVKLSDGRSDSFDLLVGCDGLHSRIREIAFGPISRFERQLGYYVLAFETAGYERRDELTYVSHTVPGRQVARISLRDDRTMFLFLFKSELLHRDSTEGTSPIAAVQRVFRDVAWEVPAILDELSNTKELYFDRVSQIVMKEWSKGRVALLGDAAACVSLMAGEGTGLAMAEAYVLAGELHRANDCYPIAFRQYEALMQPILASKQSAARRMSGYFAPATKIRIALRDMAIRFASVPFLAKWFVGRMLNDGFVLPNYENE